MQFLSLSIVVYLNAFEATFREANVTEAPRGSERNHLEKFFRRKRHENAFAEMHAYVSHVRYAGFWRASARAQLRYLPGVAFLAFHEMDGRFRTVCDRLVSLRHQITETRLECTVADCPVFSSEPLSTRLFGPTITALAGHYLLGRACRFSCDLAEGNAPKRLIEAHATE